MLIMSVAAHAIGLLLVLVAPYILPHRNPEPFGGPGGSGGLNVMTVDFGKGKIGPQAKKPVADTEPAPAKQIKKVTEPDEVEAESKLTLPEEKPKKDEPTAKATLNQKERKMEGPFGKGTDTKKDSGKTGNSGTGQFGVGTFGTGDGSGGFGTGTGKPFPFPWYIESVLQKIELKWVKPYVQEDNPQQYNCVVYFVITRAGQVRDVKVERSSGIPTLDRSAESAVMSATPFPPLPNQWLEPDLAFRITFSYTREEFR
jgi:protein TonB